MTRWQKVWTQPGWEGTAERSESCSPRWKASRPEICRLSALVKTETACSGKCGFAGFKTRNNRRIRTGRCETPLVARKGDGSLDKRELQDVANLLRSHADTNSLGMLMQGT